MAALGARRVLARSDPRLTPVGKAVAAAAACVLLAACSVSEEGAPAPESNGAPAFSAEAQELCAPVAEEHEGLLDAKNEREFEETAAAVADAEQDLAESLREVEAPPGAENALAEYVTALAEYSDAQLTATEGEGPARGSFDDLVHAAKTGVRLHEAGERAGLPEICPPPPTVDPYTTLYVAAANRDCFELRSKVRRSDVDEPQSAAEVEELLGVMRRVAAGVARALERSLPDTSTVRIRRMARLAKKKLASVEATREAVTTRDLPAYERAAGKLIRLQTRLNRQMLSIGLVSCVRAANVAGLRR